MIESKKAFMTTDGKMHPSLAEAQTAELVLLFAKNQSFTKTDQHAEAVAKYLVSKRDEVLAILKQKERVRRKIGRPVGSKNRKPAAIQPDGNSHSVAVA